MARRPTLQRRLVELLARQGAILEAAFLEAMADLRDGVDLRRLVMALERGEIESAIAALNIEAAAFTPYVVAKTAIFAEAGAVTASYIPLPPARTVGFRFDLTNPRAEAWIAQNVAGNVTGIYIPEQVEGVRRTILAGYSRGEGPETIATSIAGRIDRVTGRRRGGVLGLSAPQEQYVDNMRTRLASGDPSEMRKIKDMSLRDKRMDAALNKHIAAGTPMSQTEIDKWSGQYSDRLLKHRGDVVARTETAQATEAARTQGIHQALETEGLPPDAVTKTWRASGGTRGGMARLDHAELNGVTVQGMNTPFDVAPGIQKQYAHDGVGGAAQDANCRCDTLFEIDWTWSLT